MAEINDKTSTNEIIPVEEEIQETKTLLEANVEEQPEPPPQTGGGGGGWGGWGFSPMSYLSDLQKAADEISRNAVEAAKTAAKSITDVQEDSLSSNGDENEGTEVEEESEDENDKRRKTALDNLEKASEDSFLGQGLKVLDNTVENFASGAWQALGNAWKGGSDLVHKLEDSAINIAESIQHDGLPAAGSVAPSLLETGKALSAKGMHVLELVGKETMDLLSIEADKEDEVKINEDQLLEEVSFDRCFYIYGGPEQLEELEALSSHYTLLFNRKKAKLSPEQKSFYEEKLKEVQQILDLKFEYDLNLEKGKKIEMENENSIDEMKKLYDSSVSKAAELAAGFANTLAGLTPHDIVQRTSSRLDSLHSEGIHGLSEMCCFSVTYLSMLGKSVISYTNKAHEQESNEEPFNIDWPEDCFEKAKIIRRKAQLMSGNVEAVANSFITGISDVSEAYIAALKKESSDNSEKSIKEKAKTFSENLGEDHRTAVSKIQEGLQFLSYVVLSTSMPSV